MKGGGCVKIDAIFEHEMKRNIPICTSCLIIIVIFLGCIIDVSDDGLGVEPEERGRGIKGRVWILIN